MRTLLWIIALLLVAVAVGIFERIHPAKLLLTWGSWRLDMPLWLALLGAVFGIGVCRALLSFLGGLWGIGRTLRHWFQKRRETRLLQRKEAGLAAFAEGRWAEAERLLHYTARQVEKPWLHYLYCAKAAKQLGDPMRSARYLQQAHQTGYDSGAAKEKWALQLQAPSLLLPEYKRLWRQVPRDLQEIPDIIAIYVEGLVKREAWRPAEKTLRAALARQWDERLVLLYGDMPHPHPKKLLKVAQGWCPYHSESPALWYTLGKLCERLTLWGKAQYYFEQSLARAPLPQTYASLAHLLERTGQPEQSAEYFKKGLLTAAHQKDPSSHE